MAEIVRINSKKGMVTLTKADISEHDLAPWLRVDSKGSGEYQFVNIQPFERVAAKLFVEKYPSVHVKMAEKVIYQEYDNQVNVFLRIADDLSKGYYNTHPTKLVFNKGKSYALDDASFKEGSESSRVKSAEEEAADDEDLISDVTDLLDELQKMTPEDMIEKISPDELNEIKSLLGIEPEKSSDDKEEDKDETSEEDSAESPEEEAGEDLEEESEEHEKSESPEFEAGEQEEAHEMKGEPVIIKVKLLGDDPKALEDLINTHFKEVAAEYGPEVIKSILEDLREK